MEHFLRWLAENPYVLLFGVVAGAVVLGKFSIKGYSLSGYVTMALTG